MNSNLEDRNAGAVQCQVASANVHFAQRSSEPLPRKTQTTRRAVTKIEAWATSNRSNGNAEVQNSTDPDFEEFARQVLFEIVDYLKCAEKPAAATEGRLASK
jgi:hypothetical protein